mgnify:CR=1 FL=1
MIDTDKYGIADDVTWLWNDYPDDEGWVLWEYKECPEDEGGYTLMDGRGSDKTYEPWLQVLPALKFECDIDEKMQAIMDLPHIIQEVKRLQDALKEAVEVVKEMEGMAYADADADEFANHALEFIGNVKEMIE